MEEDKKKKDNLKRNPKEHYKNQTEGGDDDADADSDDEAATSHDIDKPTLARVIGNCTAFMCIIFIIIGELMNEQNLWAVLVIGGILGTLNVISTSIGLEQLQRGTSLKSLHAGNSVDIADGSNLVRFGNENSDKQYQGKDCSLDEGDKLHNDKRRKRPGTGRKKPQRGKEKQYLPPGAIAINIDGDDPRLDNDSVEAISIDRTYHADDVLRQSTGTHIIKRKRSSIKDGNERPQYSPRVREKGISKRQRTNDPGDVKGVRKLKERYRHDRRDRDRNKKRKSRTRHSHGYNESRFIQV